MSEQVWIWFGGILTAVFFLVLGIMLRYYRQYWLVAGYNTAPPEEQAKFDIKGLGDHLGNGLLTLSVLTALLLAAMFWESILWTRVLSSLFVGFVFLIIVGGQKFLPRNQHPPPGRLRHGKHRFLKRILPQGAFRAVEEGTRQWLLECPCGFKQDLWDAGGVRYKAAGEPRQLYPCPSCGKARWHKIRRKRPGELGGPGNPPSG